MNMASSDDSMLTEAIAAVRSGDNSRAKELLTRLLRVDSSNPEYWLWMSTVAETERERVYCLKSVLQNDPTNRAALRGLTILGAHEPSKTELSAVLEIPHRKIIPPKRGSPINFPGGSRISLILIPLVGLVGVLIVGSFIFRPRQTSIAPTLRPPSPSPSPTPAATATHTPVPVESVLDRTAVPPSAASTPLPLLVGVSPTETPYWGITPNPVYEAYTSSVNALKRGEYQSSIQLMDQVITSDPNIPEVYFVRGEAYRQLGLNDEAQIEYLRALELNPNMAAAHLGVGKIQLQINPDILPAAFDDAIALDPQLMPAYLEKMDFYTAHQQWDLLALTAVEARESGVITPLIYVHLGNAQLNSGQYESALTNVLLGTSGDPGILQAYFVQGQVLNALGRYAEAISPLKTYLAYSANEAAAWLSLAQASFNLGDFEEALAAYSQLLIFEERNFEALFNRGLMYLESGNYEEAQTDLELAREVDPRSDRVAFTFGRLYLILGNSELALESLDEAILNSQNPDLQADAYALQAEFFENADPPDFFTAIVNWQHVNRLEGVSEDRRLRASSELFRLRIIWYPVPHL